MWPPAGEPGPRRDVGVSVEHTIPLARPMTADEELNELRDVLESGQLSQGPKTAEFERMVAAAVGSEYAVATSSCTTALHLSLAALGIGPGDEVLVPDFTFPATANVVVHSGATPVLVDIELSSYNVDPKQLDRHLSSRTRAVIPVHLFGLAADMDPILEFAREHGLAVVEDAACSLGATYRGAACGSIGDIGCFSFHGRKVVTTGEGGMVVTRRPELAERLQLLRNHGGRREGGRFVFLEAGFNYRLSDLHAGVGVAQMRRLSDIIERRRRLAEMYREALATTPGLTVAAEPPFARHVYQSFVVLLHEDVDRDGVVNELRARGVETTIGTYALHDQPFFQRRFGYEPGELPQSHAAYTRGIALPLFPQLEDQDLTFVCDSVREVLSAG